MLDAGNNDYLWAFAEFTDVYLIRDDFEATVEREFNSMIDQQLNQPAAAATGGKENQA